LLLAIANVGSDQARALLELIGITPQSIEAKLKPVSDPRDDSRSLVLTPWVTRVLTTAWQQAALAGEVSSVELLIALLKEDQSVARYVLAELLPLESEQETNRKRQDKGTQLNTGGDRPEEPYSVED